MSGMLLELLSAARLGPGDAVLDVGCGTGASTLAVADRVAEGSVVGVDISRPLLERARIRAATAEIANVSFLLADAQTHRFPAGGVDILVSRLGMMFFEDPVAAFRNLGRALRPGGRIAFVAWAGVKDNPWFHVPRDAAVSRLGAAPSADPSAPGPLAFQDAGRVAGLMAAAGLRDVRAEQVRIMLTPPGGVGGAARVASRVGPAARIMKAHDGTETDAAVIEEDVARAFRKYDTNGLTRVPATINLFTATIESAS
jgi:SAM-dependent methyltransferase